MKILRFWKVVVLKTPKCTSVPRFQSLRLHLCSSFPKLEVAALFLISIAWGCSSVSPFRSLRLHLCFLFPKPEVAPRVSRFRSLRLPASLLRIFWCKQVEVLDRWAHGLLNMWVLSVKYRFLAMTQQSSAFYVLFHINCFFLIVFHRAMSEAGRQEHCKRLSVDGHTQPVSRSLNAWGRFSLTAKIRKQLTLNAKVDTYSSFMIMV